MKGGGRKVLITVQAIRGFIDADKNRDMKIIKY